jgi:hypothetical protein
MLNLLNSTKESKLSLATDPFKADCLDQIAIYIYPKRTYGKPISASIEFKKGNTSGSQKFEGADFGDVIHELQTFINSLEKT